MGHPPLTAPGCPATRCQIRSPRCQTKALSFWQSIRQRRQATVRRRITLPARCESAHNPPAAQCRETRNRAVRSPRHIAHPTSRGGVAARAWWKRPTTPRRSAVAHPARQRHHGRRAGQPGRVVRPGRPRPAPQGGPGAHHRRRTGRRRAAATGTEAAYPAVLKTTPTVTDQGLVPFRGNFYSVPPGLAGRVMTVRARLGDPYPQIVSPAGAILARHRRPP
jgi:hypothetical protein